MKLVSIIVPVYNCITYIENCIISLANLNYLNVEIICVDDGSTDGSSELLDILSGKYHNMNVIHQKKGGVSKARNTGIKAANGDYITFVDADDFVAPCYLDLVKKINNTDYIYSGRFVYSDEKGIIEKIIFEDEEVSLFRFKSSFEEYWLKRPLLYVTGTIYNLGIIKNGSLLFDEHISNGEDLLFNLQYLIHVDKFYYSSSCFYYYRSRGDSAVHSVQLNRLDTLMNESHSLELFSGYNLYRIRWLYWHSVINHYYKHISSNRLAIRSLIKKAYNNTYFRESIKYIRKNGSLDERIESYLMRKYLHWLFPVILKMLSILSSLKKHK